MSKTMERFEGFPGEAIAFLSELSLNNNKIWFDAHRGVYEAAVVSPALSFIGAMGAVLQSMAPSVKPEQRVGGSLFRIHRDLRFSPDKTPYKTHVGIRFRDRDAAVSAKCAGPLFYVEFDAQSLRLGIGAKQFDSKTLSVYRDLVAGVAGNPRDRHMLSDAMELAGMQGIDILGPVLIRPPRGYEGSANQELLRRKGLFVRWSGALPKEIHGPEFVDYCEHWFRPYVPLFEGLRSIYNTRFRKR